jgi:myo-inositol-1(or 4)-monophosphatase
MAIPAHLLTLADDDLTLAAEAALAAGAIIAAAYHDAHTIHEKGLGDLVSETDVQADRIITRCLQSARPHDAIISEELQPAGDLAAQGRRWYVDPLDGTAAFLFRTNPGIPAVLVALEEDGERVLGLVHHPLTGEWWYARRGRGAFHDGAPLSTTHCTSDLTQAWVELNQYGNDAHETRPFQHLRQSLRSPGGARLVTTQPAHSTSALRILAGEQRLAAVVHDNAAAHPKQGPWDVAAVQLITEEAGGVFLTQRGTRYNLRQPELIVVAGQRTLADALLARLQ